MDIKKKTKLENLNQKINSFKIYVYDDYNVNCTKSSYRTVQKLNLRCSIHALTTLIQLN